MTSYVNDVILRAGNVFKNMVGEIVRECDNKNIELSADVIAYAVILYFLDPNCGVKDTNNIKRSDIDIFKANCVSRLSNTKSPYIRSFQLQFICLEIPSDMITVDSTNLFKRDLTPTVATLVKEITESSAIDNEKVDLYKKIAVDIIITNRLGKPNNPKTIREVMNALKSVLTPEELQEFRYMNKNSRLRRLKNLRLLVCGIMLYNHSEGEVGDDMIDIIKDIMTVYRKVKNSIFDSCEKSVKNLRRFQKARKNLFQVNVDTTELIYIHKNIDEIEELRALMQLHVQYTCYINKLLYIMLKQRKSISNLIQNWNELISKIKNIVMYRIPVTTDLIFPLFNDLSIIWHHLWEYLRIMINIKKLLDEISDIFFLNNLADVVSKFEHALNKTVIEPKRRSLIIKAPFNLPDDCEWMRYTPTLESSLNLNTVHGFCCYLLVNADGILIPSNLLYGLIKYNKRYYAFSELSFMKSFLDNPLLYENKFMTLIRSKPHLIIFFDMYDTIRNYKFTEYQDNKKIADDQVKKKTKSIDIQTDLHPIPFYKDPTYTWNVWDFRRKAIQLANIKNCVTHSVQTDATYYRYSTKLQTVQMKQDHIQTKHDKSIETQTDF